VILEEVDEFTTDVPLIDDGTLITNAELKKTAQAFANRTNNLNRRAEEVESVTRGTLAPVTLALANANNNLSDLALPNESLLGASNAVGTMGRGLAAWVRATHDRIFGAKPGDHSVFFPPMQCYAPAPVAKWDTLDDVTVGWSLAQITADTTPLFLALPLPGIAGFIKQVGVYVHGGAGHAALPATKPRIRLMRASVSAGIVTHNEVAALNDSSVDVAAYQTTHTITLTGLSLGVTPTSPSLWTYVRFTGESGANSLAGEFKITGGFVVVNPNP
jgi:hypothetical protein